MSEREKGIINKSNTQFKDSSAKLIFDDPILCAQFLRGYVNIPLLQNVQPEDIEDETERFVHLFTEERDSDVVKKIHIKEEKTPFYLVSLIEHKSYVDYNVTMQIFRYMAFIWEDYEKEQERIHHGVSRTKGFRYPPILPIIYYEGIGKWKAPLRLQERIFLSDMLGEYIPDYRCLIVQLSEYTNNKLMEKKDELSLVMMLNKLHGTEDFTALQDEVPPEYLEKVTSQTPEYLLGIIGQIIEILLARLNVPKEEARRFADQVKERNVGELFANFKGYDVQETRRIAKEEGRREGIKEGVKKGMDEGIKEGIREGRNEGIKEGRNEGIKEGIKRGMDEGIKKGRKEGLEALVSSLKPLLPDFEAVYNAIIKNRSYADYTREEVMKYY